jgi:S1-C subfamily serine protease
MGGLRKTAGMLCIALLVMAALAACAEPFQENLDDIDLKAKSVLMLEVYNENDQMIATGSGFAAFDNYTLVTNYHVIEDASWLLAVSDGGFQYLITKVAAADKQKDIAILEFFSPTDLKPLALNEEQPLRRAEPVVAIGSPKGVTNSISLGNISALYEDEGVSYIQFTAPISHGSSGGALFNSQGEVIGITSSIVVDGQNMNLAVDIKEVIALHNESAGKPRIKMNEYNADEHDDGQAPAGVDAVGNVRAAPSRISILVSWDASPNVHTYHIYRSTSPGSGYSLVCATELDTYYDEDVKPGIIYYYRISTVSGGTESAMSDYAAAELKTQ